MATEKRDPRTYAIIAAAMEVHREPGCGFWEAVYHGALAVELLNFGTETLEYRRFAFSKTVKSS